MLLPGYSWPKKGYKWDYGMGLCDIYSLWDNLFEYFDCQAEKWAKRSLKRTRIGYFKSENIEFKARFDVVRINITEFQIVRPPY